MDQTTNQRPTLEEQYLIFSGINAKFQETLALIEQSSMGDVSPRGLKVKESLLVIANYNPKLTAIDFENRPFNWKYFAGEMAWYLKRDRKIDYINKFSSFWKGIANEDGTINSNYGSILFGKPMNWVINSLKNDRFSRQAIAYIGGKEYQYPENKDFVCTQYVIFWMRGGQLHMKVQMRSNDMFYGLTFDALFFSTLMQSVYLELKETYPSLEMGQYFHSADNMHFYERHFDLAEKIMKEPLKRGPMLTLREPLFTSNGIADEEVTYTDSTNKFIEAMDVISAKDKKDITTEECKEALSILFDIDSTT